MYSEETTVSVDGDVLFEKLTTRDSYLRNERRLLIVLVSGARYSRYE